MNCSCNCKTNKQKHNYAKHCLSEGFVPTGNCCGDSCCRDNSCCGDSCCGDSCCRDNSCKHGKIVQIDEYHLYPDQGIYLEYIGSNVVLHLTMYPNNYVYYIDFTKNKLNVDYIIPHYILDGKNSDCNNIYNLQIINNNNVKYLKIDNNLNRFTTFDTVESTDISGDFYKITEESHISISVIKPLHVININCDNKSLQSLKPIETVQLDSSVYQIIVDKLYYFLDKGETRPIFEFIEPELDKYNYKYDIIIDTGESDKISEYIFKNLDITWINGFPTYKPNSSIRIYIEYKGDSKYLGYYINNNTTTSYDSNNIIKITHRELVNLRDNGKLIPGKNYRIIDYVATTIDPESRSANHPFDIIVVADDEHTINENARAIAHEGDTYFEKCNLAAWQLKYCLDNDTNRFIWAQKEFNGYQIYFDELTLNSKLISSNDTTYEGYPYKLLVSIDEEIITIYSNTLDSDEAQVYMSFNEEDVESGILGIHHVNIEDGKGVIYHMIDENNNRMPYDFKGIQFKRYKIIECVKAPDLAGKYASIERNDKINIDIEDYRWCYLFNVMFDDLNKDNSVGFYTGIPQNCTIHSKINHEGICLPNGVCNHKSNDYYTNDSWTCGDNCYGWTCASECLNWTCGDNCYGWTCGDQCSGWNCKDNSSKWICGYHCINWTCGVNCSYWICKSNCSYWNCGDKSQYWVCKDMCNDWHCGKACDNWTCNNSCSAWTCGNYCSHWMCGEKCSNWVSEDCCSYWSTHNARGFRILAYTSGDITSIIQIPFDITTDKCQYAGFNSQGELKVWILADLVNN